VTAKPTGRAVRLGGGIVVPYPEPVDAAATSVGRGNRRTGTKPEVRLRSLLQRRGLRFRKDLPVRCEHLRVRPDIVFTRWKIAVFVDGCFWHCCPDHATTPRRNQDYWVPKLARNVARDRSVDAALLAEGWEVVRVWEHEDVEASARRVAEVLARRRSVSPGPATAPGPPARP
jgi:DNA mismatch endonuclease (patch repair protein)